MLFVTADTKRHNSQQLRYAKWIVSTHV